MAASGLSPGPSTSSRHRRSSNTAIERVSQWVFTRGFPTDVSVAVGEANFPLHKAHPSLDELEREKVCSVMDSHRLSHEARAHASQNKRLPVHLIVQVLFYDKLQTRSITANPDNNLNHNEKTDAQQNPSPKPLAVTDANVAALWKQNEELKTEVARMKIYMRDLHDNQQQQQQKKTSSSFFSSVSKKLGKLNPFARKFSKDSSNLCEADDVLQKLPERRRRYSIS